MKRIFTYYFLSIMVLLVTSNLQANVSDYAFSQSVGTYTPITGGTVYGTATSDDQRFVNPAVPAGGTGTTGVGLPIGFNFTFDGTVYDVLGINNNGWISFGNTALSPAVNMASSSSYDPFIASTSTITPAHLRNRVGGLGDDLQAQVGAELRLETIGTAPNRVCVVQFTNYRVWNNTGHSLSFQIRLNETTNVVEVVYDNLTFNATNHFATIGLGGSSNADFNIRETGLDWNATLSGASTASRCTFSTSVTPPVAGLTFAWTPPSCPSPTAAVSTVLSPDSAVISWTTGGSTSWILELGPTGSPLGAPALVTSTTDTLSGLTADTQYTWVVRDFCAVGDTSLPLSGSFTTLPTCPAPTAFGASNVTGTSVDLAWTTGGSATWHIEYGAPGFTPGTNTGTFVSTTNNPQTLTGLMSATQYDIYVRDYCGPADSSLWTGPVSITTDIAPLACAVGTGNPSFVYVEDFETNNIAGPGGNPGAGVGPWTQVRATDPDWTWDGAGGTASSPTGPSGAFQGTGFVYLETSGTSTTETDTLTSQVYDLSVVNAPARVRFFYHMFGTDIGTLTVETSSDGGTTWNPGISFVGQQQTSSADAWKEAAIDISYAAGSPTFMARFIGDKNNPSTSSFFGDMAIDLFRIEGCVSCLPPTAITTSTITFDSTLVEFTPYGPGTATLVEYGPAGFTPGTGAGTILSTTQDSLFITGLSGATSYDVYLSTDCSGSTADSSLFEGPFSFVTPCSSFVPTYTEDFTTWTGTTSLPLCWAEYNQQTPLTVGTATPSTVGAWLQDGFGNNAASANSVSATVGSASIQLFNLSDQDWLVSPEIDLTAGGPFQLDFNWLITNATSTASAQISDDDYVAVLVTIDGGTTWTELGRYDSSDVVTPSLAGEYSAYDLTPYTGSIIQIGFYGDEGTVDDASSVKFFMDNFRVRPTPSCPEPNTLTATNITEVSAELNWNEFGTATDWIVEIVPTGTAPGAGVLVSAPLPYLATGLMPVTTYDYYVKSFCAVADSSLWVGPFSFTTACPTFFVAPYDENFDASLSTPDCWDNSFGTEPWSFQTSGGPGPAWGVSSAVDHTSGTGNFAWIDGSGTGPGTIGTNELVSPFIDISALAFPQVGYWILSNNVDDGAQNTIELSYWDSTSWILLDTYGGNNANWVEVAAYIPASAPSVVQFKLTQVPSTLPGNIFQNDLLVDDFFVNNGPSCPAPNVTAVDTVTATTTLLTWDVPFGTPGFEVEYDTAGFTQGTGTVVSVADTFALVTGLMPVTDYDFYVRAICSASDSSAWVPLASITTGNLNNIGVTAVSSPADGCGVSATPITIDVENFGFADLLYIPVVVELTGDITGVYTLVLDSLPALSSVTLTLDSVNSSAGGNVTITAFTNLANDEDRLNDTTEVSVSFGLVPMAPMLSAIDICEGGEAVITTTNVGILSFFESDSATAPFLLGDTLLYGGANDTSFYVGQQETLSGTFTVDLFDTFGDGWNGATLSVELNGQAVPGSPFGLPGGSVGQETFTAGFGDSLSVSYNSGTFDNEVTYTITDLNGVEIFADGINPTIGLAFTTVLDDLLGCLSPLTMVAVNVNPNYLDTVVMSACDSMMIAGVNQTTNGFYTDSLTSVSGCDSIVVFDLTINASSSMSVSDTICDAATYTLPDGTVVNTAGIYTTTLTSVAGCDSVIKTDLTVVTSYSVTQNVQICADDSLVVGASVYDTTGTYTDTLLSVGGCDSVVTSNLVVYSAVDVTLGGVSTVCENAAVIDLTLDPIGGVLSGPGVTGTSFDAAAAGLGSHVLVYAFDDVNGCSATASLNVEVVVCTGIDNIEGIETISIYPNPYVSALNIMFDDAVSGELSIKLFDVTGRELLSKDVSTSVGVNNISLEVPADIAAGVTLLQIERNGSIYSTTLIKE